MSTLRGSFSREKPRITYAGVVDMGKGLDPASASNADWRLFASKLYQQLFTHDWIQLAESKCLPTGKSPTNMVLKEWQECYRFDQCIPVDHIIDTLKSIGRIKVASRVQAMMEDGTFLDYKKSHHENDSAEGRTSRGTPWVRPNRTQPVNSATEASREVHHRQSPQQNSFNDWPSEDIQDHRNLPSPHRVGQTFSTLDTLSPARQNSASPHNLKKSNYSLYADGSFSQRLKHCDLRKTSTWPRGYRANQDEEYICMGNDTSFIHSSVTGSHQSAFTPYSPLRSISPVSGCTNHTTGASPVQNISYFISYGYPSYKIAMEMGKALKAKGHNVMVDTKCKGASSIEECQRLFKTLTHILVLYNDDYCREVKGQSKSPLNTRYIFDLMMDEFRRQGHNVRFVPIINVDEVRDEIFPLFRDYPRQYAAYVCQALRSFRAPSPVRNEVCIQRTVYSSGGK